jgi:hypothetical protein
MVAHTGLEPVISALRGQRVNQLHQCAARVLDYRCRHLRSQVWHTFGPLQPANYTSPLIFESTAERMLYSRTLSSRAKLNSSLGSSTVPDVRAFAVIISIELIVNEFMPSVFLGLSAMPSARIACLLSKFSALVELESSMSNPLCNLSVLCVSVLSALARSFTTESRRTQRLHRENLIQWRIA